MVLLQEEVTQRFGNFLVALESTRTECMSGGALPTH